MAKIDGYVNCPRPLAAAPLDAGNTERENALRAQISALEAEVKERTTRLAESEQAREAAEALAKANAALSHFKIGAAKTVGVGRVGLLSVGVPTAAVYFLGPENTVVQAFLTVVGKLPK